MQSNDERAKASSVPAAFIPRPTLLLSSKRTSMFPLISIFTCSPINEYYQMPVRFDSITVHPNLLGTFEVVYSKTSSKHITTKNLLFIAYLTSLSAPQSMLWRKVRRFEIIINGMEGRGHGLFVVLYCHFFLGGGGAIKTTKVSSREVSCSRQEPRISRRPLEWTSPARIPLIKYSKKFHTYLYIQFRLHKV